MPIISTIRRWSKKDQGKTGWLHEILIKQYRADDMAQQLRALTVLEDLCSLLSTHRAAADCNSVTGDPVPSLASAGTRHTRHTCNQNTYKQKYQCITLIPFMRGYIGAHIAFLRVT